MKLKEATKKVSESIDETLTYYDFPSEHWMKIRTNNTIERLNREIRRRTRVVGTFPDGNSALMLVCARLRFRCRLTSFNQRMQTNLRINLDGTKVIDGIVGRIY
jgi:transposase, mutator family